MYPKKLHIEQIERFHNMLKDIDKETDIETKHKLAFKYFKLTQLWSEIDDFIDELKLKLNLFGDININPE